MYMTEVQNEIWDLLCELSGEEVANLFTNFYGNCLLDDRFREYLADEGYLPEIEDEREEW